jgi:hypothetical protein
MVVTLCITGHTDFHRLSPLRLMLRAPLSLLKSHPYATPRGNSHGIRSLRKTPRGEGGVSRWAPTPAMSSPRTLAPAIPVLSAAYFTTRCMREKPPTALPAPFDFVESAWLVAVTCTIAGEGRSAGAVYTPTLEIVPTAAFPPVTPFTLQVTLLLLVFATIAVNTCEFPNNTSALVGVTVTLTEGGSVLGGVGVVGCARPDPSAVHPATHATVASIATKVALSQCVESKLFVRRFSRTAWPVPLGFP